MAHPATAQNIQFLNLAYFGRPADPASLSAWPATGLTLEAVVLQFVNTAEYQVNTVLPNSVPNPGSTPTFNDTSLINTFYERLFGRLATASEVAGWADALASGAVNYDYLGITILQSGLNLPVGTEMRQVLLAKFDSAQLYTGILYNDPVSAQAYSTAAAIQDGMTYNLATSTPVPQTFLQAQVAVAAMVANSGAGPLNTFTLTSSPDTVRLADNIQIFEAPQAYTPGGTDLVNTLQNEDRLVANTQSGTLATSLRADLGNNNDNGGAIIAPEILDVDTIAVAFTGTQNAQTLDFQDIVGTETANITRISAGLRQTFDNLDADVATLGIANTNQEARVTIQYLNNELESATNAVALNLSNARLSGTVADLANGGALNIGATAALGGDLQHQIETFNVNVLAASTVATFSTAFNGNSFDDLVVGERPQTINIDADAALAIGTLRWLGNRVETNSANQFQVTVTPAIPGPPLVPAVRLHQVLENGEGFVNHEQIEAITLIGDSNVTLANVGNFVSDADPNGDTKFSLDASGLTGRLTADITNGVDTVSPLAFIYGGSAADRFYVDGTTADVRTVLQGGLGVDTLTYQSGFAGSNVVAPGATSSSIEWLNLVNDQNSGATTFDVNMTDGGATLVNGVDVVFDNVTIDNMLALAAGPLTANISNLSATGQLISIRSQLQDANGNPDAVSAADVVNLNTSNVAAAGTVNLQLGATSDDRATTNAFAVVNRTNTVNLNDVGNNALNLNVALNSAAAGDINLNLLNEFVSGNGLTGTTTITGVANNALNVGLVGSQAYNGAAYSGTQNVAFGTAAQTNQGSNGDEIGLNIQTGAASDVINLQRILTSNVAPPATSAASFAASAFLRNTSIAGGDGVDEVILSANLVDPRNVLAADPTYDGYFQNWNSVEELTFNNFNTVGAVVVAFDAYADAAGLGSNGGQWLTFNDVSATVTAGFRFTPTVGNIGTTVNATAANKATRINNLSENSVSVNIDAGQMVDTTVALTSIWSDLIFTSTGANLGNLVTANYTNVAVQPAGAFSLNNGSAGDSWLGVDQGSIDIVNFASPAAVSNINVTTLDGLTAAGESTTYDFSGILANNAANITLTFNGIAETNGSLTITTTSEDTANNGVNAVVTGGALADTITTGDHDAALVGGTGSDVITYNGSLVNGSVVSITGGNILSVADDGADVISVTGMGAGETLQIIGGSNNDIISISAASTAAAVTIGFSGVAAFSDPATTSQIQVALGTDTITGFDVTTGIFSLEDNTFEGSLTGIASLLGGALDATTFDSVTSSSGVTLAGNSGENSIVVVQAAAGSAAKIYYSSAVIGAGVSNVDQLLAAGTLFEIADVSSVTGLITAADFQVVA